MRTNSRLSENHLNKLSSTSLREKHLYWFVFLIFFILILLSREDKYYEKGDERANLYNIEILQENGLGHTYLTQYYGLAGPIYPYIQYLLLPVTKGKINYIRAFNAISLLIIIYLLYLFPKIGDRGWFLLSVPMTYLCAGYAMTIVPSFLFLVPSFYLLTYSSKVGHYTGLYVFVSGFFLSLAILTRLNLLILIPIWTIYLVWYWRAKPMDALIRAIGLVLGLAPLLLYVFSVWNSFLPPVASSDTGGNPLSFLLNYDIKNFLKTAGVITLIYLLFNFKWFVSVRNKGKMLLAASIVFIANYLLNAVNYLPAQVLWSRPGFRVEVLYTVGSMVGSFLILLVSWGIISGLSFWQRSKNFELRLSLLSILAMAIAAGYAPQVFSSRYAYQAVPFVLLTSDIGFSFPNKSLRMAGVVLGLITYFSFKNYQSFPYINF